MAQSSDIVPKEVSVNDDLVKSFTNEIVEILEWDDDNDSGKTGDQLARNLLENGRSALIEYEGDILPRVYVEMINGDNNDLMSALKEYFRKTWEIQYASSHPWFISFLKEYENGENHDIYESILTRTAQHGNKYMKDCPLLSIVLQLIFEDIDDHCLQETNHVFDDLWMTITNDGLQSITKYSNYILKKVLDEQSLKNSVLFQALREYYRANVLSALSQAKIRSKQNLYDLALDNVVEQGWLSDLKSIQNEIVPNRYQTLLKELSSFYNKQTDTANNGQPESTVDENPVQSSLSLPTEDVPSNADNVSDGNTENKDAQSDVQEQEGSESNHSQGLKDSPDETNTTLVSYPNAIFINGLPTNISEKSLFDKLNTVFSSCGIIKIYEKTNKPDIWIFTQRGVNPSQPIGRAVVTFKDEESAMTAVGKYNRQQVPILSNARISVRLHQMKPKKEETSSMAEPAVKSRLQAQSTIHTIDIDQRRREPSVSSNSSKNSDFNTVKTNSGTEVISKDTIFITNLPTTMPEQLLFDTLYDEFVTIGPIKINTRTQKPAIKIYTVKGSATELSGAATLTFANEESATEAIEMYNGKRVSSFDNKQLWVRIYQSKQAKQTEPFRPYSSMPMSRTSQPDGSVSIFWDMENVAIPAGDNAFDIILKLRKRLIEDRNLREGVIKTYIRHINIIPPQHLSSLSHGNVLIEFVGNTKGRDVDSRIHKDLQQFREQHSTPATVVLISGDIDFIHDINELRFRDKHYTIIIHNPHAKTELLKTANEFIPWEEFVENKGAVKIFKQLPKKIHQPHVSSSPKSKNKIRGTSSPQNMSTNDNVVKNEPDSKKKEQKNKNKPIAQPPVSLMSLVGGASDITVVDDNSVGSMTNEIQKAEKKNKPAESPNTFSCSMCTKKFPTAERRTQHEQDAHKVGTLVEISSMELTDGLDSLNQPPERATRSNSNLMAFSDNDDCDQSEPNLQFTPVETSQLVEVSDVEDNTSSSSPPSAKDESESLRTNSTNNE